MFKTKRDVDRHVSHILNRLRDEKEVTSRSKQEITLCLAVCHWGQLKFTGPYFSFLFFFIYLLLFFFSIAYIK